MSSFSDTPSLVAGATVAPYAFVKVSARNTGIVCAAITDQIVGVTDGSTRKFDSADHANVGDTLNLQSGSVVLVKAAATFAAGAIIGSNASGFAITAVSTATVYGVALEPAVSGDIVRVFKNSLRVV